MQIAYPLQVSAYGRLASAEYEEHVVQMIEQFLFTMPGERVNRPDFGCGIMEMVFDPASEGMASATQFLIQSGLQQWLGDLIQVEAVQVAGRDGKLLIAVQYVLRETQQRRVAHFERG